MFSVKLTVIGLLNIVSLLCFLYGFFPLQSKISNQLAVPITDPFSSFYEDLSGRCNELDSWQALRTELPKRAVDNLVLLIIDALRYDFAFDSTGNPNGRMKFVKELIDSGHAHAYEATVQPPTVTMPRIKAITAGVVPAFVDVVLNFASPAFTEDNLITKAKNAGRRLLFYGDDTWLRLFPDHFYDSDGVTSFIVTDYTEVDDNVTRHLPKAGESAGEWDMLILHYIGLDHIGHTAGPASPLVSVKLAEMDGVIRKIYDGLHTKTRSFSIVILGDHGMTDIGSHGGSSRHETTVPVIFISSNGRPEHGVHPTQKAQQVDLTPTLAYLLGLPTPVNSVGIICSSIVTHYAASGPFLNAILVDSLRQNAAEMLRLYHRNAVGIDWTEAFDQYALITKDYHAWLAAELCQKPADHNQTASTHIDSVNLQDRYRQLMEDVRQRMITSSISYNEWTLIGGILAYCFTVLLSIRGCYNLVHAGLSDPSRSGSRCRFLFIGCLLHALSYASSSFIEEEHLTWYFLLGTYLFLLGADSIEACHRSKLRLPATVRYFIGCCGLLITCRLLRSWNHAGIKWRDLECVSDWLIRPENQFACQLVVGSAACGIFILAFERARGGFQKLLLLMGCALVAFYKLELYSSWSTAIVRTVYVLCIFFTCRRQPFISVMLLSSVLVKATNLPLLLFAIVIQKLWLVVSKSSIPSLVEFVCSGYFLAAAMYFSLGNSNSVGHVDVSSGYVGFSAYSPVINGLLIIAHLYAGPLLVSTSAASHSAWQPKTDGAKQDQLCFLILALKGVPTAFYLLIAYFQRYHLFIWSVFAPKLLYECMHVAVFVSESWPQSETSELKTIGRERRSKSE